LGAVFVAMDAEVNREVALKQILDRHADDPTSRSRFLLEAEITGGLEHPGIVPVYGLGIYSDGRPYYAMRFIRGDSLKEAIDRFHNRPVARGERSEDHRSDSASHPVNLNDSPQPANDPGRRSLELRKLLRRFIDVCNAIDYAHSRGILHRDIKPGNIIVGRYGETLVVDWGLAKATGRADPASGEPTLRPSSASGSAETLPGSALGTPAYMSPEQAQGWLDHLGPASDVYSLGATLFSLLTGKPPFAGELAAVIRAVQQGDFRPPRHFDPTIDPALEAVCLKAMALRPEDRYGSCRALVDDVERWMADEPVTAWREPLSRRVRRWARRNRTVVAAAAVALVAGVIGLGAVVGVQAQANVALRKANNATNKALDQSEESRRQAEAVSKFLVEAFRSPDPSQVGREVKVVDVLDRATEQLNKEFTGSQATQGALLDALGSTYRGLGLYEQAVSLFTKAEDLREAALGTDHPDTLTSRNSLAVATLLAGRSAEAIALFEETRKLREARLGTDHPDTLKTCRNLAVAYRAAGRISEAIALDESTLKRMETRLGSDHRDTLGSRNNLAIDYRVAGRFSEAIALYEAALKGMEATLGPNHPDTLGCRNNLANVYRTVGRLSEAIALYELTLQQEEVRLGPNHPDTLQSRSNLAVAYYHAGRMDEAIALFEETLKLREAKLGPNHPDTLENRDNLAESYLYAGHLTEAIPLYETALKARETTLALDHPDTLLNRKHLANAYRSAGRLSEAIALHEATLKQYEAKSGLSHPETLDCLMRLVEDYEHLGRWTEAEGLLRETLARRRKAAEPDRSPMAHDLAALGANLLNQSRWSEAEPLLREALTIRELSTPDEWARYEAMTLLGDALMGQGRLAEAETLVVAGYEGMKARESRLFVPERILLLDAAERVVRLYEKWGKPDQAAAWKAKVGMRDLTDDVFAQP
jgi:serine/threonine protein kinase/tetratricopeptide (TPR) repeat protein